MTEQSTLMLVICLVTGTASLAWLAAALPMRIAPKASLHFGLANLLMLASISITMLRTTEPSYLAWPGSGMFGIAAMLVLRAGIRWLFKLPPSRVSNAVIFLVVAIAYLSLPPDPGSRRSFALLFSSFMTLILFMIAFDVFGAARQEFARLPAIAIAVPFALAALSMALRIVLVLWFVPWQTDPSTGMVHDKPAALWGYALLALVLNISLFSCVLARLITKIRNYSERDYLTGLFNRRAFEQRLEIERARCDRSGGAFSLLLLDIDHFKGINDSLGHAGGDEALRHVSRVLQQTLRPFDVLGRFGGEEFIVLLPETEMHVAGQVAERLHQQLAANPLQWQQQAIPIKASFGYVSNRFGDNNRMWLLADKALYHAKANGRDQIVAADAVVTG
ncbi:GGDEF domain-containing protein [Permianibacter sp. IMCC34836]|uniref:GGDEF domain-containing protein n=1 Tax=Permianibacter fluminis TaxID=2738515 RepID=UPI0015538190|nr:GGDEF domain-containing protein [Permianibacter fluminis]NQD38822.1 GGDEF domain-containing protein [Permianibacter fluminis]